MADMEKILEQILESQLFMQNQMNKMQGQMNSNHKDVVNRLDKLENNHKDVVNRLDRLEDNQEAIKRFMFESDKSFKKSEETYKVIQDIKGIFVKED